MGPRRRLICWQTYRKRRVFVQLVFGGDSEASVVAAGGPGQGHRRLQIAVHLVVDGAAELRPVVAEGRRLGWLGLAACAELRQTVSGAGRYQRRRSC